VRDPEQPPHIQEMIMPELSMICDLVDDARDVFAVTCDNWRGFNTPTCAGPLVWRRP
jgi:hypothetical protein